MATNQSKLTKLGAEAQAAIRAQLKGKSLVKGGVYGYTQEVNNWDIIVRYLRAYLEGNYADINNTDNKVLNNTGGITFLNKIQGKTHADNLILTAEDDRELWTYIGSTNTKIVTLPPSGSLSGFFVVTLENKSVENKSIILQASPGDTINGQTSIVYKYGGAAVVTWSGKTNFLAEGYRPRGVSVNSPGAMLVADGYRLNIAGTYILPKTIDYQNENIIGITVKNTSTGLIVLQPQPPDLIDIGFNAAVATQITILPGDAALLTIIADGIFDLITPELISNTRYLDLTLPFVTDSTVFVVASSDVTPTMNFGVYKMQFDFTIFLDASNRRWVARVLVDGVPVTPEFEIEPKDAVNNIPISYSAIVDWTAAATTHTIALEIKKTGGGGAAVISVNDFRYTAAFWNYS